MNKPKHTPGPWRAIPPLLGEAARYWTIAACPNGNNSEKDICVIHCGPAAAETDARLIAAAPAMLDLLTELMMAASLDYRASLPLLRLAEEAHKIIIEVEGGAA